MRNFLQDSRRERKRPYEEEVIQRCQKRYKMTRERSEKSLALSSESTSMEWVPSLSESSLVVPKNLHDLLFTVWNTRDQNDVFWKVVPILNSFNDLVGLDHVKEWVFQIVCLALVEGKTDNLEIYNVSIAKSSHIKNLICGLYKSLGISTTVEEHDDEYLVCPAAGKSCLWKLTIPVYTHKQLYEIFVKIVQKDGWIVDVEKVCAMRLFIENINGQIEALSLLFGLCKMCFSTRNISKYYTDTRSDLSTQSKTISKVDLEAALEIYRKNKKINPFTY